LGPLSCIRYQHDSLHTFSASTPTSLFSIRNKHESSAFTAHPRKKKEKRTRQRTCEDPLACLAVQTLHFSLLTLALVRELLGARALFTCVCRVTLVERTGHRVPGFIGACAKAGVVLVCLVDLVEVLSYPCEKMYPNVKACCTSAHLATAMRWALLLLLLWTMGWALFLLLWRTMGRALLLLLLVRRVVSWGLLAGVSLLMPMLLLLLVWLLLIAAEEIDDEVKEASKNAHRGVVAQLGHKVVRGQEGNVGSVHLRRLLITIPKGENAWTSLLFRRSTAPVPDSHCLRKAGGDQCRKYNKQQKLPFIKVVCLLIYKDKQEKAITTNTQHNSRKDVLRHFTPALLKVALPISQISSPTRT
jgi:hypothetical protein